MSAALNKDLDEARLELAKAQAQKKRELKRLESGGGSKGVLAALGVGAVQQHAGANFVSVEASAEYAKEKEAQNPEYGIRNTEYGTRPQGQVRIS